MSNRLQNEKSPYLLQHKDNPVDWYPWCEEAFQRAEKEEKPVFLSIGYSTCHWCHVMAHESFEDREIAGLLNEGFICIKVDREERPDIDAVYMSVCQAVTGSGGWPLTIMMTSEQKPFFAGTYFPKKSRYGQPGLADILKGVMDLWKYNREKLWDTGEELVKALHQAPCSDCHIPDKSILQRACSLFQNQYDPRWGGFGSAPKFPTPHNLIFLMHYSYLEHKPEALQMAEATLDAIAKGGIQDHIGGGFSRYSTDEKWLIPHFEKMLYDNALLILAYLTAYQLTKKEDYARIVRRTADYILRELTDDKGGFYCGQDADSDGIEGKYYSFTPKEIKEVLGEKDAAEFCSYYHITEKGNFEGKSIPNRIVCPIEALKSEEFQIENGVRKTYPKSHTKLSKDDSLKKPDESILKKIYEYRLRRTKLHKDDKVLLSWNSWTILALSKAGQILDDTRYQNAARKAQQFIEDNMTDQNNHLYLRFRDGEAAHAGQLEDYAVYALALLGIYESTFQAEYLQNAINRANQMIEFFEDKSNGGFYMTAIHGEKLITRPKEAYDGAIPSGNSAAALVLQKLAVLTGEMKWQEAAERQLGFVAGESCRYPAAYSFSLLSMIQVLYSHKELICVLPNENKIQRDQLIHIPEGLKQYRKEIESERVHIVIKTSKNAELLAEIAPYTANYPLSQNGPVYYLCENGACKAPVTKWEDLNLAKVNKNQKHNLNR